MSSKNNESKKLSHHITKLNFDNIRSMSDSSDSSENYSHSNQPMRMITEYLHGIENVVVSNNELFNEEKIKEIKRLLKKIKAVLNVDEKRNVQETKLGNLKSKSVLSNSCADIGTIDKDKSGKLKKKGKLCYTPRSAQERKLIIENEEKVDPLPESVKNGFAYLSGLDDSEDELKFDLSKKKDIKNLKLSNGPHRCAAPDPIKQLSGNQVLMGKSRWTRRPHSDRDLSYVKRRVDMGGDLSDDEEIDFVVRKTSRKKKNKLEY